MSDPEEDYLSDKFLAESVPPSASSKTLTYAERRQEAQRNAELKNVQNRRKSRRQLEEESRQEGLSKSLFERAMEEEQTGAASKAMAMMLKMGFKPGESLGRKDDSPPAVDPSSPAPAAPAPAPAPPAKPSGHLVDPLPLDVWSGRLGVGKRKRAVSPRAASKLAKVVQHAASAASDAAAAAAHGSYRARAREEYEERRAEGRLAAAARTCVTLDEKAGKEFNVLWLDPQEPESFPGELLEALTATLTADGERGETAREGLTRRKERLREQMRVDALQPLAQLDDDSDMPASASAALIKPTDRFPPQLVEDARVFICLSARRRLEQLLAYLRDEYFYCFWCGTQYIDADDLRQGCPGLEEEDHD